MSSKEKETTMSKKNNQNHIRVETWKKVVCYSSNFHKLLYTKNWNSILKYQKRNVNKSSDIYRANIEGVCLTLIGMSSKTRKMFIFSQARLWACGRGDMSTPSFGSHLNTISTRGWGRLYPPYTGVHTKFWKPQVRLLVVSLLGFLIPEPLFLEYFMKARCQ